MQIKFEKVLPFPIRELPYQQSQIWDKDIAFDSSTKYLVKAPSGTGKTTFLSIIYGIRRDYDGTAKLDGIDIRKINSAHTKEIRRTKLSIVFQGLKLFEELTSYENIEIKNKLTNYFPKSKIEEFAERLGVSVLLNRKADILSFGQRQRLAVIRSLCQPFDFLLLDEPFSHLDEANSKLCLDLISEECTRRGSGFILTTLGSDYGGNYDAVLGL